MKKLLSIIGLSIVKHPRNTIIAVLSLLVVALGVSALRPASPSLVATTEASWAPEALSLAESIKSAGKDYNTASAALAKAQQELNDATTALNRAEAAAKGSDLTLCARFQARYDRETGKIVSDAACPLQ